MTDKHFFFGAAGNWSTCMPTSKWSGLGNWLLRVRRGSELDRADVASRVPATAPRNDLTLDSEEESVAPPVSVPVKMRVLLAEDSKVHQKLAISLLEQHGHTVVLAENGEAAVELATTENFDIVLMDVQMPVMDGIMATKEIRASEKDSDRHLLIIALTGHSLADNHQRCLEAGMDDYLAKPFEPHALYRRLESLDAATPTFENEKPCDQQNGMEDR